MRACLKRRTFGTAGLPAVPVLLSLLGVLGCERAPSSAAGPGLTSAPVAALDRLEESVRASIEATVEKVDGLLADSASDEELAESFGELGNLYHRNRLEAEAEACYRESARLQPDDARWPYYLGRLMYKWNHLEEAAEAFETAMRLDPGSIANMLWMAEVRLAQADFVAAEALLVRVMELSPDNARAHYGLGRVASLREDWPKAVEEFELVLARQPNASEVYYPLAMAYRGAGNRDKADECVAQKGDGSVGFDDPLSRALSSKTDTSGTSSRALLVKATTNIQAKRYGRAEALQRQALETASSEEDRIAALGPLGTTQVLITLRLIEKRDLAEARAKLGEALDNLEKALAADPEQAQTWFFLGRAYSLRGDNQKAIDAFQKSVDIDGTQVRSHQYLSDALRRAGRYEEALEHSQRVVTIEPANGQGLYFTALTLVSLRRYDEAIGFLEKACRSLPNDPNLTSALRRVLAARPRTPEDLEQALELCKVRGDSLDAAEVRAIVASQRGEFETAAELLKRMLASIEQMQMPILETRVRGYLETVERSEKITEPWPPDEPPLRPAALEPL